MIHLLGAGVQHEGIALSGDEFRRIKRLYGYVREPASKKPDPPPPPNQGDFASLGEYETARREHKEQVDRLARWEDPRPFLQAGADRNALRHAAADGLRLLAWITKHVPPGEDPLKTLITMASDAGWDVDPSDVEWAESFDTEPAAG